MQYNKKLYVKLGILDIFISLWIMYVMAPAFFIKPYLVERQKSHIMVYAVVIFLISTVVLIAFRQKLCAMLCAWDGTVACRRFGERFAIYKTEVLILLIFIVSGAILRFSGIDWGIHYIFQPDEKKLVRKAIGMAAELLPYNDSFGYPNQFLSKFAAICMLIYSKLFHEELRGNTIVCYFIFRGCVAFLSTMLIPLSYLIGNYLRKGMGILLAAMVTVFPPFVNYAKQVTGDVNVLFFSLLVIIAGFYYMEKARKRDICMMTLFAAFSTLEKWHGGVICIYIAILILHQCRHEWKKFLQHGFLALGSWLVWMILVAPNLLWDIRDVIEQFTAIYISEGSVWMPEHMWLYYFQCFFSHGGFIGMLLTITGIVYVLHHREKKYLVVLVGILNWAVMSAIMNRNFERWGMDTYFILLLLLTLGLFFFIQNSYKTVKVLAVIACIIVLGNYFIGCIRYVTIATHSGQDTRIWGEQVFKELGINKENSIYEYYTTFSPGGIRAVDDGEGQKSKMMNDYLTLVDDQLYVTEPDVQYAVTSEYRNWGSGHGWLEEHAVLLFSMKSSYGDLFHAEYGHGGWLTSEFVGSWRSLQEIRQIRGGAILGPEINIYDISSLPYMELKYDEEEKQ